MLNFSSLQKKFEFSEVNAENNEKSAVTRNVAAVMEWKDRKIESCYALPYSQGSFGL
ncbi:MAG: hypothetical protein J0652_10520 [Desulfobulbaceae bacterium]|jgi:hypothetical protein|nr:hypothetical protein [Desulfobulbaceae bacterium]